MRIEGETDGTAEHHRVKTVLLYFVITGLHTGSLWVKMVYDRAMVGADLSASIGGT